MDARNVVETLRRRRLTLAVAESFTGGLLQDRITDVAGCSDVFAGGVVAYDNAVKRRVLGVPEALMRRHGAVSPETAVQMARGVRRTLQADVGLSTTGIAGPTGATPTKPVGTSIAAVVIGRRAIVEALVHRGRRDQIKDAGTEQGLRLLLETLKLTP